jgi:hypothetical protein
MFSSFENGEGVEIKVKTKKKIKNLKEHLESKIPYKEFNVKNKKNLKKQGIGPS